MRFYQVTKYLADSYIDLPTSAPVPDTIALRRFQSKHELEHLLSETNRNRKSTRNKIESMPMKETGQIRRFRLHMNGFYLYHAVFIDKNVFGFQITMQDSSLVAKFQSICNLIDIASQCRQSDPVRFILGYISAQIAHHVFENQIDANIISPMNVFQAHNILVAEIF